MRTRSETLLPVPREEWPKGHRTEPVEVWLSARYLVLVYAEPWGIERMTVCRIDRKEGSWADGIPWDDLQRLKQECGRGEKDAVEIYPADRETVNVANMRHLWILPAALAYGWDRNQDRRVTFDERFRPKW